jgi:hypothetical protein
MLCLYNIVILSFKSMNHFVSHAETVSCGYRVQYLYESHVTDKCSALMSNYPFILNYYVVRFIEILNTTIFDYYVVSLNNEHSLLRTRLRRAGRTIEHSK